MPSPDITKIPAPRTPLIDENSGDMTPAWYRFFYNIFVTLGEGSGVLSVIKGGTGQSSYTDGQLLIGNSVGNTLDKSTLTPGGGIDIINGHGSIKIANTGVTSVTAGTGISITSTTGDSVISNTGVLSFSAGTTGLLPSTTTVGSVVLSGTLNAVNGGTGQSSYAVGNMLYATTTSALSTLPIGASNYILASNGTMPNWVAPSTVTVGVATNLAGGGAGYIPYQSGVNTTAFLAAGSTGQVLSSNGTSAPSWITIASAPVTKTADFTVATTDIWLINNKSGSTCTVTLPAASSFTGRVLRIQNYQAQLVVSASSNVIPLVGGAASTAILSAIAGDTATLVSDGSNWVMTQYVPNNVLLI